MPIHSEEIIRFGLPGIFRPLNELEYPAGATRSPNRHSTATANTASQQKRGVTTLNLVRHQPLKTGYISPSTDMSPVWIVVACDVLANHPRERSICNLPTP